MSHKAGVNSNTIKAAADASWDIYKSNNFTYLRTVEQFSLLSGELVAGVRFINNRKTAVVAIRGSATTGNWLFTNFQAHYTEYRVVDESLSVAKSTPYQGGFYRTPVKGTLHQGIFRAFSWLWYGTEPILGTVQGSKKIGITRLIRYCLLFILLPLILWCLSSSLTLAVSISFLLGFIFVTTESGVWEDIFKGLPEKSGKDPYLLLSELNLCEQVIFTGHSLGGAIATIAFAVYRCWCQSDCNRRDNAELVTFGAPRVGDVPFMEDFSSVHKGRFCHVVHPGDPVPELPPNGLFELWRNRYCKRGGIGWGVIIFFPVWALIRILYAANRAARWTHGGLCVLPRSPILSKANHDMEACYLQWAKNNTCDCGS